MLTLFGVELIGLVYRLFGSYRVRHIDFKSTIVSVGIFGTFFGILGGLYDFDSLNINTSVPLLLEGLKFAFATSVIGMFLSMILSIIEKFCHEERGDNSILVSIDQKIGAMNDSVLSLSATLKSPSELVNQFSEMKTFLHSELQKVNDSLDVALKHLARGASQEVIKALEKIITEFNTNLQEQFGENFQELNIACGKLLDWQKNYRTHVDSAESHLVQILTALDKSAKEANALVQSHQETREICRDVGGLIKTYDIQVQSLAAHLESCKQLGAEAKTFLSDTQQAITQSSQSLNSFSGVIQSSVSKQSESLAQLTQDIDKQLPEALGELERILTDITNQFANDYRSLFQFMTDRR